MTINIALVGARLGDAGQTNWQVYSTANRILAFFALLFSLSYFVKKLPSFIIKYRFWILIFIAFAIRIFSIISAPNPTIDVFYILRDGAKQILAGKNPYDLEYPAPYGVYIPKIIFVYGPLTPFIFLPSVILFNDPRYTLVAADLLSVLFLFKLAKYLKVNEVIRNYLIIIFLFHPLFPFMTEQAWLEPVMTFLLISSAYFLVRSKKNIAGGLLLGAILAIKSVYFLPVLTYLRNSKAHRFQYILAILLPIVMSAPFFIANQKLFLERTQIYVSNPEIIQSSLAPTHIALNIAAVILKYAKIVLPTIVVILIGLIVSILTILKSKDSPAFSLLSLFLVFIILFMFGPFVFVHYFAFLGNILIVIILMFSAKNYSSEI